MISRYTLNKIFALICPVVTIVSMAAAFVSCSKENHEELYGDEILFTTISAEVKAAEITSSNISNFGVYATLETNGEDFATSTNLQNFMNNIPVTKSAGVWSANPKYYWPVLPDRKLCFFAYAPHNGNNAGIKVPDNHDWQTNKDLEITYTPNANPYYQTDLCVARAVLDRENNFEQGETPEPVKLNFRHTLSWVSFAANYIGSIPSECFLRIDEVTVNNAVKENTLTYNSNQGSDDFFSWAPIADDNPKEASYTLSISGNTLGNIRIPAKTSENIYTDIVTANGYLFMLPQNVNSTSSTKKTTMGVTFSYVKDDNSNTIVAQFYASMVLPESSWEVAKKTKYSFTLDVTTASLVSISTSITDWTDAGNNHIDTEIK